MAGRILVTGAAGFIGYHTAERLLTDGNRVIGLDNFNSYYDPALKEARATRLRAHSDYREARLDLTDGPALAALFERERPTRVVHLAAQAGVRHSLTAPQDYLAANLVGFSHMLEACRRHRIAHLVYASTSSVYGANSAVPFAEDQYAGHPMSLYAATKRANELMAHAYAHLFTVPMTGLRFFTVYGPWGRPDMAAFKFARAMLAGEPIEVFNHGHMARDFTYVGDIVEGLIRVLAKPPTAAPDWNAAAPHPATSGVAPYAVFNIGRGAPVGLMDFISAIESRLGLTARKIYKPMQPGDVAATHADVTALHAHVGYTPRTSVEEGVRRFLDWYLGYHGR